MAGETTFELGDIPLTYASWRWPRYRGAIARIVEMSFASALYKSVADMAKTLRGNPTTLKISGPARAGTKPGADPRVIRGVYIDRVVKFNEEISKVYLADARLLLARRVCDMDFLIRFGDEYLDGTDKATYKAALSSLAQSIDVMKSNMQGSGVARLDDISMRDGQYFAGMALPHALSMIENAGNCDLTVDPLTGKMLFVDRLDASAYPLLPGKDSYDWYVEPAWFQLDSVVLGRPKEIYAYYNERHCLRMFNTDPRSTSTSAIHVELEQVYAAPKKTLPTETGYYTLSELLTAFNQVDANGNVVSFVDADIAGCFMTDTFQGTAIEADGSADRDTVIKAIKDGWRVLWRITTPRNERGVWTDWAFGKIREDGSTAPVPVECPWVEFQNVITPAVGSGDFIGSQVTINKYPLTDAGELNADGASPFSATWEGGDASQGIIRLTQKPLQDGNIAIPGTLTTPLKIVAQNTVATVSGDFQEVLKGFKAIESEDWRKAKFLPTFKIAIYVCATKRQPNNETRWKLEKVKAYKDGDIDYIELPVGNELLAVFDYGDTIGGGKILNQDAITSDAENRAEVWKLTHTPTFTGEGVAERHQAFFNTRVEGAVSEVVLEFDDDPDGGCAIRSRIKIGDLADATARTRNAQKRLADRRFAEAGKVF